MILLLFSPGPSLGMIKRISVQKLIMIISSLFLSQEPSQDKQWTFGERLFQMCWFSKFSLYAKPSSRLIDSWQMHSPTFIQKIRFVYLMHSFCFFHHCDMVQSFSSILLIITRMHLLPLVLLQSTTNNIINHNVLLTFSGGTRHS